MMSDELIGTHRCRWPDCPRITSDNFWGCHEHWSMVPVNVRFKYTRITLRGRPDSEQSTECLSELAKIDDWVRENRDGIALQTAALKSDKPAFVCGCTSDGLLMLLWPQKGEYITVTKEEARTVARAMRGLFASDTAA